MSDNIEDLINYPELRKKCNNISRPVIDRLIRENMFPHKVYLANRVFWRLSEVEEFMRLTPDFNKSRCNISQEWINSYHSESKK